MALTEAQIDSVFEICELPRATTVERPNSDMGLTSSTYQELNTDFQLQLKLEQRLAVLSTSQETKLIEYIDRWDSMSTCTTTVNGSVGGIGGVEFSPIDEMSMIQKRVQRLVGVYQMIDEIKYVQQRKSMVIPILN